MVDGWLLEISQSLDALVPTDLLGFCMSLRGERACTSVADAEVMIVHGQSSGLDVSTT